MPSIDNLIVEGEKINDNAASKFESGVKTIESAVLAEIRKIFGSMDVSGGRISPNQKTLQFLASLEKRVLDALKKGGYNSKVSDLLKKFDVIKENNIAIQGAVNSLNIASSSLNDIQKFETQNAIDKLLKTGINKEFINPMREALYRNVSFGGSVADAEKIIEDYVLTKGNNKSKLLQYTGQVARDTISQFDGSIQAQIGQELNLKDFLYSGSIITDSRAQCIYWVEKRILLRDELEEEIKTASSKPPGSLGGKKCSGMIPGTNINNFATYRGGYNCRHRAVAVNAAKLTRYKNEKAASAKKKQENDLKKLQEDAKNFGPEVDKMGKDLAKKYGGTVTPINYKSQESILRKANSDMDGDVTKIQDAVRNTIIVDRKKINNVIQELQQDPRTSRYKAQLSENDPLGYSGNLFNVKSPQGTTGEIQVNTKWMIYAKEKEKDARMILGDKVYDEIKAIKKLPGGLGHEFYEEWRTMKGSGPEYWKKRRELEKKSREYYANFYD